MANRAKLNKTLGSGSIKVCCVKFTSLMTEQRIKISHSKLLHYFLISVSVLLFVCFTIETKFQLRATRSSHWPLFPFVSALSLTREIDV